jgi:tRNA modification GTPase
VSNADAIAAIATAAGRAGIGVVRVSGNALGGFTKALIGKIPTARLATLAKFRDSHGELIDQGIALYFPAPASYTGEDVLELHGHGGDAVLRSLLQRCLELGARMAQPGEFTQRAFLNDKLDLAQAEAVADLIDASTVEAARSAVRSLSGEFSQHIHGLVKELIDLRMLVEATLDFPEEEIDFLQAANTHGRLDDIEEKLKSVFAAAKQGSLLRAGIQVAIVGRPNAGKSSLLNQLAGEPLAIVTEIPGTTRDPVRAPIQIEGVPLHLVDTAGLRDTEDVVERLGVERSWAAAEQASIVLHLIDATLGSTKEDRGIRERLGEREVIEVFNKMDLIAAPAQLIASDSSTRIFISVKTGQGLEGLKAVLLRAVGWQPSGEGVFAARERHLHALTQARTHVQAARQQRAQLEVLAEELRRAQNALSTITGEFSADDLLGEIFSRFCIGK